MRLTCPNCKAQYEVEDSVVPPEGRDVQCSGCGTTWFQYPANVALEMRAHDLDDDDEDEDEDDAAPVTPARPSAQGTPRIDRTVLDVLRQEAERELGERRRSRPEMGTQAEMGLAAPPRGAQAAAAARTGAAAPDTAARRPAPQGKSRGGLLPDIDELSTTLSPSPTGRNGRATANPPPADGPETPAPPRRDFLRGLVTILTIAAVLAGLYLAAPWLAEQVPALAGALAGYVALVDTLRNSLAELVGG